MLNSFSKNHKILILVSAAAIAMLILSFASVPLYRIFCQVVGYGGTTQRGILSKDNEDSASYGTLTVRLDSNVNGSLPWKFYQEKNAITVPIGENEVAYYVAKNQGDYDTVAQATFNVTPFEAGQYFVKVDCFCFTEQKLAINEEKRLPVNFYIDKAILDDPDLKGVDNITLSYTFFSLFEPAQKPKIQSNVRHEDDGHDHGEGEDDGHAHHEH